MSRYRGAGCISRYYCGEAIVGRLWYRLYELVSVVYQVLVAVIFVHITARVCRTIPRYFVQAQRV